MRPVRPKTPLKKCGPPTKPKPKPNLNNRDSNADKEPVEVFCRLRPLNNYTDLVSVQRVVNSDTLIRLCPPNGSQHLFYKFKHVFDENTSQKQLFDSVALPLTSDLINGKNGLLFTYGITSSGKTHTIKGSPQEPGILPRCLDVIFNTLNENNLQSRKYVFKPDGQNHFVIQSMPDALLQWQNEKSLPKTPSMPAFGYRTPRSAKKNVEDWDSRVKDNSLIEEMNCDNSYAVFISYVEIYNSYIYDLLDDSMDNRAMTPFSQQQRPKALREDRRRRVFVYEGTEVEVKSADEAFEVFMRGVRRRRIERTNLNNESSRSHSVFTIRLVQAPLDANGAEVVQDDRFLITSQLSIVDLAGSERTNRTQNKGDRLREAGNINNSLMALRNIIDILRENQQNGTNKVIPYRDNKLTHLFKSYFEGEGKVKMIICVNPSSDDYDETLHVMKFAEHSQDVMVSKSVNPINRMNFRIPKFYECMGGVDLAAINIVGPPFPTTLLTDPEDDKVFPEWLECLETRKRNKGSKFEQLKEMQLSVRQRVVEMERENMYYRQQLSVMQMDLEAREHQVKNYENKCFQSERVVDSHTKKIMDLEKKLRINESSLEENQRLLSQTELEKERLKSRMRDRLDAERDRIKNIFERLLAEKQAQLEREQCVSKDKMNLVKQILNADNTNWEFLRENREVFYPTSHSAVRPFNGMDGPSGPSTGIDSQASTQTPQHVLKRKSEFEIGHYGTPLAANQYITNTKSSTPQTIESVGQEPHSAYNPPPVVNPRHRRSLSGGNEKWIDHRPPGTLDLGTVLRPKIKNKKSVSNLKASDVLNNASKYALTHHEADLDGHVETHVYKGEVIPSSSGGAQVIFNDVETLKQGSPPIRKRTVSDTRLLSPQLDQNQVITEAELHSQPVNPFTKRSRR